MAEKITAKKDNTGAIVTAVVASSAVGVGLWLLIKGKGAAPSLKISNPVVYPGYSLNFSFERFTPSADVSIMMSGSNVQTLVVADERGAGQGQYLVPLTTNAGNYVLTATDPRGKKATAQFKVDIGAWYPMLAAIVDSPLVAALPPLSYGWAPMLAAVVNSPSITALPPLSFGWAPMLTALVNSGQIIALPPLSFGWQPMLTSLVNSAAIIALPPQSYGWAPMLTALVNSPTLKRKTTTQFVLNVFADPDNAGFVEVTPPGTVFDAYTLVTLRAWSYNESNYVFAGWYTAGGNLRSSSNPITVQMSADITLIARFTAVSPPPVSGPDFPAPGVVGDGQYWYWLVFVDGSKGWYTAEAYYTIDPSFISMTYGPYASGATS